MSSTFLDKVERCGVSVGECANLKKEGIDAMNHFRKAHVNLFMSNCVILNDNDHMDGEHISLVDGRKI